MTTSPASESETPPDPPRGGSLACRVCGGSACALTHHDLGNLHARLAAMEGRQIAEAEALAFLVETVTKVSEVVHSLAPVLASFAESPVGRMFSKRLKD